MVEKSYLETRKKLNNSKQAVKKVNSHQKAKRKVRIMFFAVKMQQDRCRLRSYKLNCKKQQICSI